MPFKSEKQRRFLWAEHPEIAKEWAHKYPDSNKNLPMYANQDQPKKPASSKPETKAASIHISELVNRYVNNCKLSHITDTNTGISKTDKTADSKQERVDIPHSSQPVYAGEERDQGKIDSEIPTGMNVGGSDVPKPKNAINDLLTKLSVVLSPHIEQTMENLEAEREGRVPRRIPRNRGVKQYPCGGINIMPPMGMAQNQPQQAQPQQNNQYPGRPVGGGSNPQFNPINSFGALSTTGVINGNAAFGAKNSPDSSKTAEVIKQATRSESLVKLMSLDTVDPVDVDYYNEEFEEELAGRKAAQDNKIKQANDPIDFDKWHGKAFKIVTTPPGMSVKSTTDGTPIADEPGRVSIVTPENGDSWNWPDAPAETVNNFKKNWGSIQGGIGGYKMDQIRRGMKAQPAATPATPAANTPAPTAPKPPAHTSSSTPITGSKLAAAGNKTNKTTPCSCGCGDTISTCKCAKSCSCKQPGGSCYKPAKEKDADMIKYSLEDMLKSARCWAGYEPVPGKKPYSNDSCRPVGSGKKKKKENKKSEKKAASAPDDDEDMQDLKRRQEAYKKAPSWKKVVFGRDLLSDSPYLDLDEHKWTGGTKKEAGTPAWQRSEGKNEAGGLNEKGRKSYEREHGGNLKAPVTQKNPKGEAKKRQNSFCARMCGMKRVNTGSKTKSDPDSRINKSLRKWNCKCSSAMTFGANVGAGTEKQANPLALAARVAKPGWAAVQAALRAGKATATGAKPGLIGGWLARGAGAADDVAGAAQRLLPTMGSKAHQAIQGVAQNLYSHPAAKYVADHTGKGFRALRDTVSGMANMGDDAIASAIGPRFRELQNNAIGAQRMAAGHLKVPRAKPVGFSDVNPQDWKALTDSWDAQDAIRRTLGM